MNAPTTDLIGTQGRGVEAAGSLLSGGNVRALWRACRPTLGR
jgi:hypothetical protein